MKYLPIGKELFIENRQKLAKKLKINSLAIFNSNDIMPTNADGSMPFRQNNDLFYLSGIDQEETILFLFPDCQNPNYREILFIKETNDHIAIWDGNKLTKKEASEISGVKTVCWNSQFEGLLNQMIPEAINIYLNTNEHTRAEKVVETKDDRFIKWIQSRYPLFNYERLAPIMQTLRAVKSEQEIELIKIACGITEKSFRRVLKFLKPGISEYELEAEFIHEFIRNRSRGPAYQPIIASGLNACTLHYTENNRICKEGELVLMDVAAEYANYASDMTRTIPVSGKFTKRQKEVYNAVLRVMKEATKMLVPGNNLTDYQNEVGKIMEHELIGLKLLDPDEVKAQEKSSPLYKKYFMHGTSHALGLDVHDVFNRNEKFKEGMIFTCEPGIYIKEEAMGIRLENDILITSKGPVDLMNNIPIEIEEIEQLMNQNINSYS
jgi:Xaa-Pro aminopeptidase